MDAARIEALGGAEAEAKWRTALDALQAYAHASKAPLGSDVTKWFGEQTARADAAVRAAR